MKNKQINKYFTDKRNNLDFNSKILLSLAITFAWSAPLLVFLACYYFDI
jgi:hypothetical protein